MARPLTRPLAINRIGWAFVIGAVVLVLSALLNYVTYVQGEFREDQAEVLWSMSWRLASVVLFFHYFWLFFTAHLALAAIAGAAGVSFMRQQYWARMTLEGLAWLPTVSIAAVAVVWLVTWITTSKGDIRWAVAGASAAALPAILDAGEMLVDVIVGIVSLVLAVMVGAVRRLGVPAIDDLMYWGLLTVKTLFMMAVAIVGLVIVKTLRTTAIRDAMR